MRFSSSVINAGVEIVVVAVVVVVVVDIAVMSEVSTGFKFEIRGSSTATVVFHFMDSYISLWRGMVRWNSALQRPGVSPAIDNRNAAIRFRQKRLVLMES